MLILSTELWYRAGLSLYGAICVCSKRKKLSLLGAFDEIHKRDTKEERTDWKRVEYARSRLARKVVEKSNWKRRKTIAENLNKVTSASGYTV